VLGRRDLDERSTARLYLLAERWIEAHGPRIEAVHVLQHLLWLDAPRRRRDGIVAAALQWLERHGSHPDAHAVLRPLVTRTDLEKKKLPRILEHAIQWITAHDAHPAAPALMEQLLDREDLPPREVRDVVSLTLGWMERREPTLNSVDLLCSLLFCTEPRKASERRGVTYAMSWLDRHAGDPTAGCVLHALCFCRHSRRTAPMHRFVLTMMVWLSKYGGAPLNDPLFEFVFKPRRPKEGVDRALLAEVTLDGLRKKKSTFPLQLDALPALLPVAARGANADVMRDVESFASKLLHDERVDAPARRRLAEASNRLLEAGAWPDRRKAKSILTRLGLWGIAP
jgi:hypothetical protein